jgi:hypothetical protein
MEEALDHDHDEVVQTCGSLTKLEEIVLVNATGISKLMTIMRENVSTVAVLQSIVDETSIQVKTMAEALREVMVLRRLIMLFVWPRGRSQPS